MLKLCTSMDWDWGERSTRFLPSTHIGVDRTYLNKYAAGDDHRAWLRKVAAVEDHELLHIIAVADSEHFGYNRNADGFSGKDNCTSHTGFTKHAYVFRNHAHDLKKGHPTFGKPVASFYHPEMKRIELVNAVNKKTAGDIIQAAAKGDDVAWSMGASVPHDVCTICGNKASTPDEYCEHAKRPNLGRILKTGEICGLDNPGAQWFDISHVFRPAERIAYTIRTVKTAAANGIIHLAQTQEGVCGGAERAKVAGITLPDFMPPSDLQLRKWATLQALAAMEKHVPSGAAAMSIIPEELSEKAESALHKRASRDGHLNQVCENLHSRGILLRPEQLFKVAFGADNYGTTVAPLIGQVHSALPGIYSRMLNVGADDLVKEARFDGCSQDTQEPMSRVYEESTRDCDACASIDPGHVEKRLLRTTLVGPPRSRKAITIKTASVHPAAEGLADMYAAYGLSFAAHSHNGEYPLAKRAVVQINHGEYQA